MKGGEGRNGMTWKERDIKNGKARTRRTRTAAVREPASPKGDIETFAR